MSAINRIGNFVCAMGKYVAIARLYRLGRWLAFYGPGTDVPCPVPWPECSPEGCSTCGGRGSTRPR
jgi:hypothetical protein